MTEGTPSDAAPNAAKPDTAKPDITPETRIGALLDAYPALEDVLVAAAPAFAKLRNPVLRRTVAKVATVERAAGVAGLSARELVVTLRRAAGLGTEAPPPAQPSGPKGPTGARPPPDWVRGGTTVAVFDADAMLARGEVPLGPVLRRARELGPGEQLRVDVAFPPEPLREAAEARGHAAFIALRETGFALFIGRRSE